MGGLGQRATPLFTSYKSKYWPTMLYLLIVAICILARPSQSHNHITLPRQDEELERYCIGGPDPTCYFPDPNDPHGFADEGSPYSPERRKRDSDPIDVEAVEGMEQPTTPQSQTTTTKRNDDQDEFDVDIEPLNNEKELSDLHLKQYEPNIAMLSYYPPWSYQGFYPPKEWDNIPAHYFAPKRGQRATNMSKMLEGAQKRVEAGLSFMEFGEKGTVSNCSSDYPSPIDISTNATEEPSFVEFNIMHYDVRYGFLIFFPDDGTDLLFVKLQTPLKHISKKPSIDKGSVLGSPLTLDRILIHYGTDPTKGSEHRLNGKSFGMELQFMFTLQTEGKESTYYDILYEYAVSKDSSLFGKKQLALCIFVEVGPTEEKILPTGKRYNKGMGYLAMAAREFGAIRNSKKFRAFQVKKKVLTLEDFFHVPFQGHYYTYFGSLTHPPCFNNTRYSVFENPIYISHDMWRDFLFLPSEFSDTGFVADNFRPLESINVWNNESAEGTREIVPYLTPEMKEKISWTVAKSKFATSADRLTEYDYMDDGDSLNKTNGASKYPPLNIPWLTLTIFIFFSYI